MINDNQTVSVSDFKDRTTGLVVFGILEIILGTICALIVPLMIFSMFVSAGLHKGSTPPVGASTMLPGILIYVLMAVWFIWMGIGSIKARRWARALWLVSSWFWLISGIMGLVFMLVFLPNMYDQMGKSGQMTQQIVAIMKYTMIGFMVVFYVIIPGTLVFFYGSKHVKATCERKDPKIRWTDRCPLPVLAVSLISGFSAASILLMGFYGWTFPFFGLILTGIAGAGVAFVSMLLHGYVAWGTYRLSVKAWWCAVVLTIAWGISMGITFSRVTLMEFYEKMNFSAQLLENIKQFAQPASLMVQLSVLWFIVVLAYLLYTKKYFIPPTEQRSILPGERI
ncbi:MAG: hypothetical protein NT011_10340 [Kiritimatiellaeota bacterium]|nr:hypothetical protein [Kiritimatiellota bacterium]